jgi:beta-glucosidase
MTISAATTEERSLLAALPVAQKVRLLTGADSWRTHGVDALGLRSMIMSDGPAGVRGVTMDERKPAASLPCPSALGATWDSELVYELGTALGVEARSKGVDVLLAPTLNLVRTPLGGRGFEFFSEDPQLTARLAVSYVRGVQSAGVAATVKHYVGNDSETERWDYDARIAEHVLRELYLVPFEASVREAGVALVMAAYNGVNGHPMTEHRRLLLEVLKEEWGFTGVVTSDWDANRSTVASAVGGLDLAMPGPNHFWGKALADAVASGAIAEEVIDDKVLRLLRLARRVGALTGRDGRAGTAAAPVLADPGLLRRAAAASFVLLRNTGSVLPLDPAAIRSIAVIGPNAIRPVIQGGGSAGVVPVTVSTPADALIEVLADQAAVTVTPGCRTWTAVPAPAARSLTDPVSGEPGVRLEFRAADGTLLADEHRATTVLAWWGDGLPPGIGWGETGSISLLTRFRADAEGPYAIGAAGVGRLALAVDGEVLVDARTAAPADPVETMTRPGEVRGMVHLAAGQEVTVGLDFYPADGVQGPLAVRLGIAACPDEDTMLEEAVDAASRADIAVVVVGSAEATESEGYDRDTLNLPGRQDELIERVSAANDNVVVVVNSGMPVLMPWVDRTAAVIQAWLPGQAMGYALTDVLLGAAEPGGRLPVTVPASEAGCPVLHAVPEHGRLSYDEGLLIGYRGYDASGVAPLFPFGHGLGYTGWAYESLIAAASALPAREDLPVAVTVRNTGPRPGREIVQAYLAGPQAGEGRPVRVLAAFGVATAEPGETAEVMLRIPARAFAIYDPQAGGWTWPPGVFTIEVGRSSRDLRLAATVVSG